jgi:hypothetical protein
LALEKALEYPSTTPRDLFLLTHPRSVNEPDVQVAARRLLPQDRLFALTVNGRGEAELLQLRRGLPVRLRSFRVEFTAAAPPAAASVVAASGSWTGDVEPIGWPFRFGNDSAVQFFEFDATGQHLFALMKNSMLYAWKLTGGDMEILPRPQTARGRITEWHDMVGVVGGVALLGSQDSRYVVAHYDWKQQSCKVHFTKLPIVSSCQLSFVRHCNAVALTFLSSVMQSVAIDLATGELAASESQYVVNVGNELEQISRHRRVERAISYLMAVGPATNVVAEVKSRVQLDQHLPHPAYHFSPENASLTVMACGGQWRSFVPHRDGKKTFEGARIREIRHGAANQSQQTLAIHYTASPFRDDDHFLSFFRGPASDFLRELRWVSPKENSPRQFRLSSEGDKVAMLRSEEQIEVQYTDRPQRILFTRPRRWFSPARLWVGQDGFLLCCGKKGYAWHLVQWSTGILQVHSQMKPSNQCRYEEFNHPRIREFVASGDPEEVDHQGALIFGDAERWPKGLGWNGARFVLDRHGQVLVFDIDRRLVLQFFAYGDSWTAWTPDGMRYGHGMVHHWPNVPGAPAAMGKKLLRATRGGSL